MHIKISFKIFGVSLTLVIMPSLVNGPSISLMFARSLCAAIKYSNLLHAYIAIKWCGSFLLICVIWWVEIIFMNILMKSLYCLCSVAKSSNSSLKSVGFLILFLDSLLMSLCILIAFCLDSYSCWAPYRRLVIVWHEWPRIVIDGWSFENVIFMLILEQSFPHSLFCFGECGLSAISLPDEMLLSFNELSGWVDNDVSVFFRLVYVLLVRIYFVRVFSE